MFAPRQRPSKQAAVAELQSHLIMLGTWCLLIRGSTYVMHALYNKRS